MEGEVLAIVISCLTSGLLLVWKLIKRLRKSKCYMENENGDKIIIDFGLVEKEIDENIKELDEEKRKKLKEIIIKNFMNKSNSENKDKKV